MPGGRAWRLRPSGPAAVEEALSRSLGLHPVAARVAAARGIGTEDAPGFFDPASIPVGDPLLLPDMGRAVEVIRAAIASRTRILVYGDYDADGVTATVIMLAALRRLGANCTHYIPHRIDEGYGLHPEPLQRAASDGVGLVVTVDTGTSAASEIEMARGLGMEVVVTDHHCVPDDLPPAAAVVNPHRADSLYPFRDMAGVGVALLLAGCLLRDDGAEFVRIHSDLAALGTVADVMPLTGENRRLVHMGLEQMNREPRPGIRAIMDAAGRSGQVRAWELGFVLAPRLNAAGRMGESSPAVDILTTDDPGTAASLAAGLEEENRRRRQLESDTLAAARQVAEFTGAAQDPVLVVSGQDWHPGVLGLVASRMADMYLRPALVVTSDGDVLRGSGRSAGDFDLYSALGECDDLLRAWGGHEAAAGLEIDASRLEEFRDRINALAGEIVPGDGFRRVLTLDAWVPPEKLDMGLAAELARFEPCGVGNPLPTVGTSGPVSRLRTVGSDGSHLLIGLGAGPDATEAVGFGLGHMAGTLERGSTIALAAHVGVDTWRGSERVRLRILDAKPDDPEQRNVLRSLYLALTDAAAGGVGPLDPSTPAVVEAMAARGLDPGTGETLEGLAVFQELGLVHAVDRGERRCWLLSPSPRDKVDLHQSPTYVRMAFGSDRS